MGTSIGHLQAMVALSSAESAQGASESTSRDVQQGNQERKELQQHIRQQQKRVKELQEELERINNKSGFEKFVCGLFGSDCGAGEVADKMKRAAAEMKKAQQELQVEQARIEMMLQELQSTSSDLARRTNQREKIYDENAQSLKVGF